MNSEPLVSILVVVYNGQRFIRHCLDSVARQTYRNIELIVLDNASTDATADIVSREYPAARLIRSTTNHGMWPGQELLMQQSAGVFICALSVDVILDADFIREAVRAMMADTTIAAVQGKVYQYRIAALERDGPVSLNRSLIDTCGFSLTKSRRVGNIGHGEPDSVAYATARDVLGAEGAVPFYRRDALMNCAMEGHIADPDYFWYGDDFDLAWRMTLFGYRQRFIPSAVAWHDRSTTKGTARIPVIGQLARLTHRRAIPVRKRRWDWSNTRFTIIKNDYIINILRDAPFILVREISVLVYTLLFEPSVLPEIGRFLRLLPTMLRRRRIVLQRARTSPEVMHAWYR